MAADLLVLLLPAGVSAIPLPPLHVGFLIVPIKTVHTAVASIVLIL